MPTVELRIQLVDGRIQVHGPLHDKILCLGMLELAKGPILEFNPGAPPPGIQAPPPALVNHLGANRNGR